MTSPPNTLATAEAAAYVGARSPKQFLREVARNQWPPPIVPDSRPMRWSVAQLDAAMAPAGAAATEIDAGTAWLRDHLGTGG